MNRALTQMERNRAMSKVKKELADAELRLLESEYGFGPLAEEEATNAAAECDRLRGVFAELANGTFRV